MSVAVRELKASLSQVLSRARSGEVIEVTSHNKPIARIVGIPETAASGLRRLIADGAVSWGGGKPRHKAPVRLSERGASVSQIVLEDRG
jgi:prevent-host-death family protein